ncbi:MAG TPA: hypothetical protein VMV49_16400 [Candidatus Deferrimicrobium sp.]|nr:hypothetical protein [Candidatus Deferrimicrobium sp.]
MIRSGNEYSSPRTIPPSLFYQLLLGPVPITGSKVVQQIIGGDI